MLSFYKKPAYFFSYIRKSTRIRFIRNRYRGSKMYYLYMSKDLNDKNNAMILKQYFKNRGRISFNVETCYFRYQKDDLILSNDNYDTSNFKNVFENVAFILNKALSAVIKLKEFAYKTRKNDDINYKIGCIKDTNNYKYKIIKPILYKTKNINDDDFDDKLNIIEDLKKQDINFKEPKTICHLFYLSYKKIENIVFFLNDFNILDILDYYYNDYEYDINDVIDEDRNNYYNL